MSESKKIEVDETQDSLIEVEPIEEGECQKSSSKPVYKPPYERGQK